MYGAILAVYVLIILGIGFYTSRYIKNMDDFALAGRNLGLPMLVGTLFASFVGGATVTGWTGSFYQLGFDWWFAGIGSLLGVAVAATVMAEKSRKLEQYTVPDLLELRYDNKTKVVGSIMIILGDIGLVAVQIIALSGILTAFVGLETMPAMILSIIVFTLIALFGGMVGVALTDSIQAIIIALGLIVGVISAFSYGGGIGAVFSDLPDNFLTPLGTTSPGEAFNNAIAVFGTTAVWQAIIFSRAFAAKDSRTAKMGILWLIPTSLIGYFLVAMLGYSARSILGPDVVPDEVFATLLSEVMNPAVAAILLAVIVGAIITSTNSFLLSISINITRDLYQNFIGKDSSDKSLLKVGRVSLVIVAALAFSLAVAMPDIVTAIVFAYTMYSAALLIPLYGGYLWKKANSTAGFLGIIFGGGTAVIWHLLNEPMGLPPMVPAVILSLIVFVASSYMTEGPSKEQLKVFDV
ncbi:sodium:solute symporter family protein [Natranaerobius thermophilus]|uniref:Na+/solute symporter n=1 Tax=Natranaerobius thermophilus (strain ATCC BAA-1301 / DSM 18059 / JW/NM-WN-LF) TaxID=457570 RepID=B2A1T1_NATTJ|nr:sodium:solute symporter family protein [Natranaerobius thermophilus]ACB86128.1 Na+/solute symporter [Natranaerobius thermophilus JW/NM-WN-LF]